MDLTRFIAGRYFFTRKKTRAINIISGISMGVFVIGTAVMIIILSLLNGLEDLVRESNDAFDPDLKISVRKGKVFPADELIPRIDQFPEIEAYSRVLEENVVVRYGEAQEIARIKGVDRNYVEVTRLDTLVAYGRPVLQTDSQQYAIVGLDLANRLNVNTENVITRLEVIVPKKGARYSSVDPSSSLSAAYALPSGVLLVNKEDERDFLITSLSLARDLLEYKTELSGLELKLRPGTNASKFEDRLQAELGDGYDVRNRYEQNETAYNVFRSEKWMTFALLSLIILLAAFNAVGALTMLVLEKKQDIKVLKSLGADSKILSGIFIRQGIMMSAVGGFIGLILGVTICLLQDSYGLVKLEGSLIDAFPVSMRLTDILAVYLVIVVLGWLAALYPSRLSIKLSEQRTQ